VHWLTDTSAGTRTKLGLTEVDFFTFGGPNQAGFDGRRWRTEQETVCWGRGRNRLVLEDSRVGRKAV